MSIIVAVSGTRRDLTEPEERMIRAAMKAMAATTPVSEWRVGDCPTGVDALVRSLEREFNPLAVYEAKWDLYGRSAGPRRNQTMLTNPSRADILLAFPVQTGSGTQDCIRTAMTLGVDLMVSWLGSEFNARRSK